MGEETFNVKPCDERHDKISEELQNLFQSFGKQQIGIPLSSFAYNGFFIELNQLLMRHGIIKPREGIGENNKE